MTKPLQQDAEGTATSRSESSTGVDLEQIERMLQLSPIERVEVLEDWINGIAELRGLMDEGGDVGETR